jgi:branched-chain amino acid transport system permease protein
MDHVAAAKSADPADLQVASRSSGAGDLRVPMKTKSLPRRYALLSLLLALLAVSALLDEGSLSFYVLLLLTATVTVGLSLLMGQAGQVSLGQGAFYACGAYTAGVLATNGYPTALGLLTAPLVTAALAAVVGIPLLVLRGHHLAFATLALHLICLSVIGEMTTLTGGDIGLQNIPRLRVGPVQFESVRSYAYLGSLALFLGVLIASNILASRPGRALRALSTSEVGAASAGVPVERYKLAVFVLSAAFAGLAGGIYAFHIGYLAPGSFPVLLSIEYVVMATVGGIGTISGAIVGSTLVMLLVHVLSRFATMSGMPSSAPVILSYAVYACVLVAAVQLLPRGLVDFFSARWTKLRRRMHQSPKR